MVLSPVSEEACQAAVLAEMPYPCFTPAGQDVPADCDSDGYHHCLPCARLSLHSDLRRAEERPDLPVQIRAAGERYRQHGHYAHFLGLHAAWQTIADWRPLPVPKVDRTTAAGQVYEASRRYRRQPGLTGFADLEAAWAGYVQACAAAWSCFRPGVAAGTCPGGEPDTASSQANGVCEHCQRFSPPSDRLPAV